MPWVEFRPPTAEDITHVARHLRPADRAECEAAGHTDMRAVIETGVRTSVMAWVATVGGEPAFICGVAPLGSLLGSTGVPWLLGTPLAPRHSRALMRHFPTYIDRMLDVFSHLLNCVHTENTVAIAWLKRMGFEVKESPIPVPPHGATFYVFEMHRPCVSRQPSPS